jgi:hypothetical protein
MLHLNTSLTATGNTLQKICEQEWIVWRRTGYPSLVPAVGSTSHIIPRRFPYGNNEYSTNTENVTKAAAQYNVNGEADSQYGRVWWDEK